MVPCKPADTTCKRHCRPGRDKTTPFTDCAAQEKTFFANESRSILGGPTAAIIAYQNPHIKVSVVDRDQTRIRRWNSRHPPIYEPGLHDIVRVARDGARETTFSNEPTSDCDTSTPDDGETTIPRRAGNLVFTTDVAKSIGEADIVLVAVNTPTKERGVGAGSATDMTAFEAVTGVVAQYAREGAIIVEKSTVPCRTAQLVAETVSISRPIRCARFTST